MAPLEAALFESGRPVLIAPPEAPKTIGRNVLVSWNGSTEQAHTNAFAMPLLRLDRIYVRGLHIEHGEMHPWRKASDHAALSATLVLP